MPAVAERLPWTLRAYRGLASAATPIAPMILANRLRRGKEHPQRIAERRGESRLARPNGPLIWAHGASVGEMLAVIPLVEGLRARNSTSLSRPVLSRRRALPRNGCLRAQSINSSRSTRRPSPSAS